MRFGEHATSYARHAFVQRELAEWGGEWLPDALPDGNVLELGAGPGLFTQQLLSRFEQVTATDVSPEMVQAGQVNYPHADWRVLNAWQRSIEDAGVAADYLCSSSLLQWAPDPVAAMMRMAALLQPGGRMLHLFFVEPTLTEFGQLAPEWKPLAWRSGSEWCTASEAAGLTVLRCEEETRSVHFDNARELLRFFQRTGAVGREQVCPQRVRRFIKDYERQFRDGAGVVSTWTFFRVALKKPY